MSSLVRVTAENFDRLERRILAIEKVSFPSPWTSEAFREEVQRSFSSLWVFLDKEEVRGYICFWSMAGELHLMNIAVHPERRREGLGRTLLEKMIITGIREGAECALLEVRPSNTPARALYKKAGFHEIGRRTRYYRDTGEDAILMALQLKPSGDAGPRPGEYAFPLRT
jgi:ribosomal-protein-alanine N-acetyltransferase